MQFKSRLGRDAFICPGVEVGAIASILGPFPLNDVMDTILTAEASVPGESIIPCSSFCVFTASVANFVFLQIQLQLANLPEGCGISK